MVAWLVDCPDFVELTDWNQMGQLMHLLAVFHDCHVA
jgi:hypothetical protein